MPTSCSQGGASARPCAGVEGVELACQYLLAEVRQRAPRTWDQGARCPPLPCGARTPALRLLSERRLHGVSDAAARGIAFWSNGFDVEVLFSIPPAAHILALQAQGRRSVSLLKHQAQPSYHEPLPFLLHDLCHLAKFAEPQHYAEQVGFFKSFARALEQGAWNDFENDLDETWLSDRNHVLSDMNGSSVFLFAALKMKLKMAARRRTATLAGHPTARAGALPSLSRRAPAPLSRLSRGPPAPLSLEEQRSFRELLDQLLDLLGMRGSLRKAAIVTSARRDCPRAATELAGYFRELGLALLA